MVKRILCLFVVLVMASGMITLPAQAEQSQTIRVGKSTSSDYSTINDALNSITKKPVSEEGRIYIDIEPGDYVEQVILKNLDYITLRKLPGTEGTVRLLWYYCVGYSYGNCDLNGNYDPTIDWSREETWKGYNQGDEQFTAYQIGQKLDGITSISYYDTNGVKHKNVAVKKSNLGDFDIMATMYVDKSCNDIELDGLYFVNTIPVMVLQEEKDAHVTPQVRGEDCPKRDILTVCDEDTPEIFVPKIQDPNKPNDPNAKIFDLSKNYNAGESAYLVRSRIFNERGHAASINGQRTIIKNCKLRGNQDSLYVGGGYSYFENCDLIGGTDYIYGGAQSVFNKCTLGMSGYSDNANGGPITAANTPIAQDYGYLFYDCYFYNNRKNTGGGSTFGRPWREDAQVTFYNTTLDFESIISPDGWSGMSGPASGARFFEYGTKNKDDSSVDTSKRVVSTRGKYGTVLDKFRILEYNPRNYLSGWDPMNFGDTYLQKTDETLAATTIIVDDAATTVTLPAAPAGMEFMWESASPNIVYNEIENTLTLIRPAYGSESVFGDVYLYALDSSNGFGDIKTFNIEVKPYSDTSNAFNMPVTVSMSTPSDITNFFAIELYTEAGAFVKSDYIVVNSGETMTTKNFENLPAGTYKINLIVSDKSYDITVPDTVTGTAGETTNVEIFLNKTEDINIKTNASYTTTGTGAKQTFDLIALAKEAGAGVEISEADSVTIKYDLDVTSLSTTGHFDLISGNAPAKAQESNLNSRFIISRLHSSWNQIDSIDSLAGGFSGTADNDNQWLNNCGKFQTGTTSHVEIKIDYKNQIISMNGTGSGDWQGGTDYTFGAFPSSYKKGDLKFTVYPGNGNNFTISNISVEYRKSIKDQPVENKPFVKDYLSEDFTDGRQNSNSTSSYTLDSSLEGTDIQSLYCTEGTTIDSKYIKGYKNFIGKTGGSGSADPYVSNIILSAGTYTLYYIGSSSKGINMTLSDNYGHEVKVSRTETPVTFASGLMLSKIEFTTDDIIDGTLSLTNDSSNWLPDMYSVKIVGLNPDIITPTPTPISTSPPTSTPTSTPTVTSEPVEIQEFDFTEMDTVPVYNSSIGYGFVETSGAIMPPGYERHVAPASQISVSSDGAKVIESTGSYLVSTEKSSDGYNFGGLIYRVDTGVPGLYKLEVEVIGNSGDTNVAPTGMDAGRLTSTSAWDTAGNVNRLTSAKWEGSKWTYDFATGQDFVEIEIEPKILPTNSAPQTVGIKSIKVTPITTNQSDGKPTIHILGDSTQKTYTFGSTISAWGQTLVDYFDTSKVNVVNYSMGGRSMKANYTEGRADDVFSRGKVGDYVFIHSAHNDESDGKTRFVRGTNYSASTAENNVLYDRWLDTYVSVIRARGMTPVFVSAMPRVNNGKYNESTEKPNGFNPDSPGNMRKKAATSSEIGYIELYAGAKAYIDSVDAEEIKGIYNSLEAGESPADGAANGNTGDGTHYKEAASRQWSRIMLQSIYDQSVAINDTYKDKEIMKSLVSYMKNDVKNAVRTKNWSAASPELTLDVSAVGAIPGATKQAKENYYYRNAIEKVLQLGIMQKSSGNMFYPTAEMTVGEFARDIEKAFDLPEYSLTSYNKTYKELSGVELPTAPPLPTPYPIPTASPSEPRIVSVTASNGSTTVMLENITSGVVIGATYADGVLTGMKTADVKGSTVIIEGIEADTVYVWESLENMVPICESANQGVLAADEDVKLETDEVTVTVEQPSEGGQVTIYNESKYQTATTDIKEPLASKNQISDTDYYTLTAPETIKTGTDKGGVFAANPDITIDFVEVHSTAKHVTYTAKATGTATFYMRFVDHKYITFENMTDGTKAQAYMNHAEIAGTGTNVYGIVNFEVEDGKTYDIYGQGGTARLFGVKYASDYENSTESLVVNNGDSVRISAKADAYWLNDSILVNGAKVSSEKEYTITVSADTTVSAVFVENPEPKLVETTIIASDAALTREAMGAVLYDAYLMKFGKQDDGTWNKPSYMSNNGGALSPDDPNYDPNIIATGQQYYPLTGWAALTDTDSFDDSLYGKTKEAYNLGLIRTETGIARSSIANGKVFEPKVVVTRAKAAKTLAFLYNLTQAENAESQVLPNGNQAGNTAEIKVPTPGAPSTPWIDN